jgi:hypothetical protein
MGSDCFVVVRADWQVGLFGSGFGEADLDLDGLALMVCCDVFFLMRYSTL